MGKKSCKHNQLITRLQDGGKLGNQTGYCSQQCKKMVDVFVPKPTEHELTQCPHCIQKTKTIAKTCLTCKKEK